MINRHLTLIYIVFTILLFENGAIFGQSNIIDFVKPVHGTKYEFSNTNETYLLRIPINTGANTKSIKPKILGVSFGNQNDQVFVKNFTIGIEEVSANENLIPALLVTISTKDLHYGTYSLLVSIQPEEVADNSKNQVLNLELTLPPGKLQTSGTLKLEQTISPFDTVIEGNQILSLWENSGKQTLLDNIEIRQISATDENNRSAKATLIFEPPIKLEPGKADVAKIKLSNVFPLGITKGNILITSPQMEQTIIPFEVKARRHWGYIIGFMFLGLIFGFLVRIWSQQQIDLHRKRLEAEEIINVLEEELKRHPDSVFADKINPVIDSLKNSKVRLKTVVIETEIKNAQEMLKDALIDFDERRKEALTLFKNLSLSVNKVPFLPKEFTKIFNIKNSLDEINQNIVSGNISKSIENLNTLIQTLDENLNNVLIQWKPNIETFITEINSEVFPLLATVVLETNLTKRQEDILIKLGEINSENTSTVEVFNQKVEKLANLQIKLKEYFYSIQASIQNTGISLEANVNSVNTISKEAVIKFFELFNQFHKKIADWAEFTSEKSDEAKKEIRKLKESWQNVLIAQVTNDESVKKQIENLLEENKFREATASVIKHLRTQPKTRMLGSTESLGTNKESSLRMNFSENNSLMTDRLTATYNLTIPAFVEEKSIFPLFKQFQTGSSLNYRLATILRFAVSGFGIVAVGYILFADKFIGTVPDLLAVFIWAFGIDLTLDAFISAGSKLKS